MSLLDDVSIVVTPNGYKAGELYAVVPEPTEGNELVTNGDFSNGYVGWNVSGNPSNYSIEVVDHDGKIDVLHFTTSDNNAGVNQVILQSNKLYLVKFDLKVISGNVYVGKANNRVTGSLLNPSEWTSYEQYWTANDTYFRFYSSGTAQFYLDNVSVKEYTSADMDVTRETAATRVDEDGLVNYAEVIGDEEVTNEDFSGGSTGWTVSNTDADNYVVFDGSTARLKFLNTSPVTEFKTTDAILTGGKTYKLTVDIALATSGGVKVDGNGISETFNSVGLNERIITPTSTASLTFYRATANVDLTFNSVSVKEVTRDNVPRIDYTGGGCPHILSEPQRTNTVIYSEDFSQYNQSGTTPTLTTGQLAPDGTLGATKISGTIGSSVMWLADDSSTTATRSIYARTVSGTGTATLMSYFLNTNNLFTLTEEWQRFELTGTTTGAGGTHFYIDFRDSSQTLSEFIVWGGQSEEATYATSYIPNFGTSAGVTRNQDIFTRDGIGSLINSTEGVLFVEMAALSDDLTYREISLSDGTSTNRIEIRYTTNSNRIQVLIRNGSYVALQYDVSSIVDFNKVAFKWKTGDFALWVNGVERATDATAFVTSGLNRLAFDQSPSGNEFFGKVRQLQVYNTALTDSELATLTT